MTATVQLDATDSDLRIVVLNAAQMHMWRAEFKSVYLEDICRKTGQPLTYLEFNSMLKGALEARSDEIFVDLLNINDLQMLKGQRAPAQQSPTNDHMQKRYLILTTLANEKKFHYPLPLAPVDITDVRTLDKETVKFVIKHAGQAQQSHT